MLSKSIICRPGDRAGGPATRNIDVVAVGWGRGGYLKWGLSKLIKSYGTCTLVVRSYSKKVRGMLQREALGNQHNKSIYSDEFSYLTKVLDLGEGVSSDNPICYCTCMWLSSYSLLWQTTYGPSVQTKTSIFQPSRVSFRVTAFVPAQHPSYNEIYRAVQLNIQGSPAWQQSLQAYTWRDCNSFNSTIATIQRWVSTVPRKGDHSQVSVTDGP